MEQQFFKSFLAQVMLNFAGVCRSGLLAHAQADKEFRQQLAELGFVVDGSVTVVSEIAGNLILQVKESRIALDRTLANRVMI